MKALTIYARRVKQGETTFYKTSIPAESLVDEDYYKSDAWNTTTGEGYQREQNPTHVRKIATYLEKGDGHSNVMPQDIVINFRMPLSVKELGNGMVELTIANWPGYVIDGQHRIQATSKAIEEGTELEDYEFGVTITNFSVEQEMVNFRNLNFTGLRPPKGLGQVISSTLMSRHGWPPRNWTEQAQNRAVSITSRLNNDVESIWYGKIALGGIRKRSYHLTGQASFVATIESSFLTGRFSDPNEKIDHVYELIKNFWDAVETVWPAAVASADTSLIQRLGGFSVLNRIMGRIYSTNSNASKEEIVEMLTRARVTIKIDDLAWGRSAGLIRNMRAGYSANKGDTVASDYLWNGMTKVE